MKPIVSHGPPRPRGFPHGLPCHRRNPGATLLHSPRCLLPMEGANSDTDGHPALYACPPRPRGFPRVCRGRDETCERPLPARGIRRLGPSVLPPRSPWSAGLRPTNHREQVDLKRHPGTLVAELYLRIGTPRDSRAAICSQRSHCLVKIPNRGLHIDSHAANHKVRSITTYAIHSAAQLLPCHSPEDRLAEATALGIVLARALPPQST
jgi:hypothetical protein